MGSVRFRIDKFQGSEAAGKPDLLASTVTQGLDGIAYDGASGVTLLPPIDERRSSAAYLVPEPSTAFLLTLGLVYLVSARKYKRDIGITSE